MSWGSGQEINQGRYKIIQRIGTGGFGVTYKAFDRKSATPDTVIAIKTLNEKRQRQANFEQLQENFLNEALSLARCSHPHVIRVEGVFMEGQLWAMVMDYIEGESLEDYIMEKGRLAETQAVEIIRKIGDAVSYVHSQQLLHRDIKPANIMMRSNGEPVLIDFGLARAFVPGIARTITIAGTPHYSPPEQAERRGDFTPTLDIYALAATLYTCVTGDLPVMAEIRMTRDSLTPAKELNPQLSDRVNHAIITGMALKPEDRSSTVAEWLDLLQPAPVSYPEPEKLSFGGQAITVGDDDTEDVSIDEKPSIIDELDTFDRELEAISLDGLDDDPFADLADLRREETGELLWIPRPVYPSAPPPPRKLAHQKLSFQTAKIEFGGLLGNKLKIVKQQQQAEYIEEDLGKGVKLKLVSIPSGSFLMGAPKEEKGSLFSEQPQHRVNVPGFHMGVVPVTQAQYQAITGNNPAHFQGNNLPVEQVSWNDTQIFLQQLNDKSGRKYRLPSEAEWEYACRAGTTTPFHFGETIDAQIANYQAQDWKYGENTYSAKYGKGQLGVYREKTTPVGSFEVANDFGLYDMHANVWEWCQDTCHENYQNAPTNGSAWVEKDNDYRLLRGGSWCDYPGYCRSAYRLDLSAGNRNYVIGFRIVLPQDS